MADIFTVGELEECEDDNENNICTSEGKVVIEEPNESQTLLNNSDDMTVLEDDAETDDTLKQDESSLETQDELSVNPDDLLPPVEKLEKYANSDLIVNRQLVARNLPDTLRLVSAHGNDVARVFMVLGNLWDDFDACIRTELMLHFPQIAAFCKEANLNQAIEQHLLPVILLYLEDDSSQVRKVCHSSLLSMVEQKLIDYDLVCERICPIIVHLTGINQSEDLRMENILLMSKMIVLLGPSVAQKLYFEKFFDLCEDRSNNIRKVCASTFGDICAAVGPEITEESLLPVFCVLCEDIAWCVRKACVENFMPVSCIVRPDTRSKPLANLYMILLSDQSRWVRLTAYQALGPFISTFANPSKTGLFYINDSILYSQSILSEDSILYSQPVLSEAKDKTEISTKEISNLENPQFSEPKEPSEVKCNGDIDCTSLDDYCRTSSDFCDDSEVPRLGTNCASDIPGIMCHVGSCCTVIGLIGTPHNGDCDTPHEICDPTSSLTEKDFAKMWEDINSQSSDSIPDIDHSLDTDDKTWCLSSDACTQQQMEESYSPDLRTHDGETIPDESAFNHFQYWRIPLPEIDSADLKCQTNGINGLVCCYPQDREKYPTHFKPRRKRIQKDTWPNFLPHEDKGEPPPSSGLSPYDQDIVPPELLLQYLNMIDAVWAQTIDPEIARHCAYSLPAVALTLGRKFWPCLKDTFDALSSDLQGFIMMWKVRRTVAFAMHRLAVILGPEITSTDLLPVFARFINDLDEVRIGVLQHLYDFLKVLRPAERKQFLPSLPEFLVPSSEADSHERNWRFRHILAEQLVSVAYLYDPQEVCEHLVPLALTLVTDKVCEVRLAAVRVMAAVIRQMSRNPTASYTKKVMSELAEKFVRSDKWLYRQLYVYICQEVIAEDSLPVEQFAEDALPQLLYLSWDRVPNVRLAIARCLATVLWPLENFSGPKSSNRELLLETIHILQCDSDADVVFYADKVSTRECSCLQNVESDMAEPFM